MAAITQISKIQLRHGNKEDLPTLGTAEMGWCLDSRELYIGTADISNNINVKIITERDLALALEDIVAGQVGDIYVPLTQKGALNGVATLGPDGIVPSTQLPPAYTLPTAGTGTNGALGGVKVDGTSITIDINGVIHGANTYTLPTATTTILGGVKADGTTITVDPDGTLHGANTYTLPTASASVLGGVKVGSGLSINPVTGVLTATPAIETVAVSGSIVGSPLPDDITQIYIAHKDVTFSAVDSVAAALIAPTANYSFEIRINNTLVGSISFTAGSTIGTVQSTISPFQIFKGQLLSIHAAAMSDDTLGNVAWTIVGS